MAVVHRGDRVFFQLEVGVPLAQAATFSEALTGNDDDIVLAAERAMRDRIEEAAPLGERFADDGEEIELALEDEFEELRHELRTVKGR